MYDQYNFQSIEMMEADDHIGLEFDFMYRLNQHCI
nr:MULTISPECIES: hypothetical protein [Bacillus]